VQLIGTLRLQDFWGSDKKAKVPFQRWTKIVAAAKWHNFAHTRQTFSNASWVLVCGKRKFVVFNVGGNKYRLVTTVNYQQQTVIVEFALTHEEYDKGKWKVCV
jgi:mRNA interferase HigB